MFTKALEDPVYYADVTILIGPFDEYVAYIKEKTGHDSYERTPAARVTFWEPKDGPQAWYFWIPNGWPKPLERRHYRTLLHETRHLSDQILRERGVKWSEESEEAFTYHQAYWFDAILDVVEEHQAATTHDRSDTERLVDA